MNNAAPAMTLDATAPAAITIGRSAEELRALWLDPDTQSRIWTHFADVTAVDPRTADWVARGLAGASIGKATADPGWRVSGTRSAR